MLNRPGKRPWTPRFKTKATKAFIAAPPWNWPDGTIITGNNSPLLHAASGLIIHAIKHLADIPEKIKLLPPSITDAVSSLKDGSLE